MEFRYPEAPSDDPAVLRGVDLRIAPGETLALVGATGSGKTTFTSLVPRLYEPTRGTDHGGRPGHRRHAACRTARLYRRRLRGLGALLRDGS
ncbi:MAG: ATP-binding cassette domain-containing protein [Actinopolymorphaceae bacterium]